MLTVVEQVKQKAVKPLLHFFVHVLPPSFTSNSLMSPKFQS